MDSTRLGELCGLSEKIGYVFHDFALLNKALTHRSYANERQDKPVRDNERLEFLGDAVLDLIVSRYLLFRGQNLNEGELSKIRSQVVNEGSLARLARMVGLGAYLLLGRGEEGTGGRDKSSLLANAFEALIAAVYLDSTFETAYHTFLGLIKSAIDDVMDARSVCDYKGQLQQHLKTAGSAGPQYRLVEESGPDHNKTFRVCVYIGDEPWGEGVGRTKKEAEQIAARSTYETLRDNRFNHITPQATE